MVVVRGPARSARPSYGTGAATARDYGRSGRRRGAPSNASSPARHRGVRDSVAVGGVGARGGRRRSPRHVDSQAGGGWDGDEATHSASEASSSSLLERPAKVMARRGLASRRESERLMQHGLVRIDGAVHTDPGRKVRSDCAIDIMTAAAAAAADDDGTFTGDTRERQKLLLKPTVLLHKPAGVVSTQPDRRLKQVPAWTLLKERNFEHTSSFEQGQGSGSESDGELLFSRVVSEPWHMAVVGRLDKDSRGLLLMTQDGVLARNVIGTKDVWKKYLVRCKPRPTEAQIRRLNGSNLRLDGVRLLPMRVKPTLAPSADDGHFADDEDQGDWLEFRLREGKKHQIRRTCAKVGLQVLDLFRVQIGPFSLGGLAESHWRLLAREEVEAFLRPSKKRLQERE